MTVSVISKGILRMNQNILETCKTALEKWKLAFNSQDAEGCAAQYEESATMVAKPFGTFVGRKQIQLFWQDIMDQGFADVDYSDSNWVANGDDGYVLSAKWTMNKAFGVIHKEYWKIQPDGTAMLHYDEFEVLGER